MNNLNSKDSNIVSQNNNESFYRDMLRIRLFEEKVLTEFSSGNFRGTTHTCIGQEANAVAIINNIGKDDIVVSNHRSHGHFLAYGGDMKALFAELMGKSTGVCGGRGGSQHLHWKNFYSNGVLGGTSPIATGIALSEKLINRNTATVLFLGDGALGEGVVYETLNMAALWSVPILFVVENNHIAQTTAIEVNLAGEINQRFEAFGINSIRIDSSDVIEINKIAIQLLEKIKSGSSPHAFVIDTHRFGPHSKGDDTRSAQYIQTIKVQRDPISIHAKRIMPERRLEIEQGVLEEIEEAYAAALADPMSKRNM